MFLFERIIGIGTYSFTLIVFCFLMSRQKDYKKMKILSGVYTFALAAMAFAYVPYETADLYRVYGYIEAFEKYNFTDLWNTHVLNSQIGLANIIYWLVGQIGIPQLLPFFTTIICYSCIFYIALRSAEKNGISGGNLAIALFFYMSTGNFMFVVSGIRCMLGISLFAFCFFRENVEKKFNILHIPLYIISAFIHYLAAVLILMRFVIPIFDLKTTPVKRLFYWFVSGAGTLISLIVFSDYIENIMEKADSYLTGDMYSYVWEYVIGIIAAVVFVYLFARKNRVMAGTNIKLNVWLIYDVILLVVAVVFCYEFTIFHRLTTYIMPIISLPLMMTALENKSQANALTRHAQHVSDVRIGMKQVILILSTMLLALACVRGTLSSLKFFIWQ